MKKKLLLFLGIMLTTFTFAAPVKNMSYTLTQPDGKTITCYITGDEFYRYVHDSNGYPLVKGSDGYLYYALSDDKGKMTATPYRVGTINPSEIKGTKAGFPISEETYLEIRSNSPYSQESPQSPVNSAKSMSSQQANDFYIGDLNTLVVFIRLKNDPEFTLTYNKLDQVFNSMSAISVRNFFLANSYNKLNVKSHFLPYPSNTKLAYYQDIYERPYYTTGIDNANVEHALLERAINHINTNSPIEDGINLDKNNDGNCDNVIFIISGVAEGWADLLWPHAWSLYTRNVYVNTSFGKKKINSYSLSLDNSDSGTHCHETFHVFGTPDFYRYDNIYPNGDSYNGWDPMNGPNVLGLTHNRWKYQQSSWVEEMPWITESGTYTINASQYPTNNCYRIQSPYDPLTYFVVEYRQKQGLIEGNLPGSGLLIYRIDTRYSNTQNGAYRDPVYMYRPGGTLGSNGTTNQAHYSKTVSRTAINDNTAPSCFLQDGSLGGLDIYNIGEATNDSTKISFSVRIKSPTDSLIPPMSSSTAIGMFSQNTSGVLSYNSETKEFSAKKENAVTNTTSESTFQIRYIIGNKYRVRFVLPKNTNQCIAIDKETNKMIMTTYSSSDLSHHWELTWANSEGYFLRNCENKTLCMTVSSDSKRSVEALPNTGSKSQMWDLKVKSSTIPVGSNSNIKSGAYFKITNKSNSLAFLPRENSSIDGTPVLQTTYKEGDANQLWQIQLISDKSAYVIRNKANNKVLSCRGLKITGLQLFIETDNAENDQSQQWDINTLAPGIYSFVNRMSNMAIDNSNKTIEKAPLIQTTYNKSSANQQWILTEMEVPNLVQNNKFSSGSVYWSINPDPTTVTKGTTNQNNPIDGSYYRITHNEQFSFNLFQNIFKQVEPGTYEMTAQVRSSGGFKMFAQNKNDEGSKVSCNVVETSSNGLFESISLMVVITKDTATIGFEGKDLPANSWIHIDNVTFSLFSNDITTEITQSETVKSYKTNNYPNPFHIQTTIQYVLKELGNEVTLTIYDTNGQMIEQVKDLPGNIGANYYHYDGSTLRTGNYFYVITAQTPKGPIEISSKIIKL